MSKTAVTTCLECSSDIPLPENVVVGEIVPCADCGTELEVVALEPLKLRPAPEIEEDWGE